mgnify:CR=1 FL=1
MNHQPGSVMRGRLLSLFSCLLLTTLTLDAAHAVPLAQQRQMYDEAKRALAKGDSGRRFRSSR